VKASPTVRHDAATVASLTAPQKAAGRVST